MNGSYIHTLLEARNGKIIEDIDLKLRDLLAAIVFTGKAGKIGVVLTIKPSRVKDFKVAEVAITHECKINKPEQDIGEAVFFISPSGMLTREDPEQQALFGEATETSKEEHKNG